MPPDGDGERRFVRARKKRRKGIDRAKREQRGVGEVKDEGGVVTMRRSGTCRWMADLDLAGWRLAQWRYS